MIGGREILVLGVYFIAQISVVSAEENTGIIVASVIAGALFLLAFAGITIFCFYKRKGFSTEKPKKSHKKHTYVANGAPPQEKHRKHHRHKNNHYKSNNNYQMNGVHPGVHHIPVRPVIRPYATYHGPPLGYYPPPPSPMQQGTMSGPPPVVVIPTPHGTIAMRPDPRPVLQKKRDKRYHRTATDVLEEPRRHKRSRSQPPSEFLIEQSPDGIPVIRPVIYEFVDDDKDKHRSRSKHKSRDRTPSGAQVIEIKVSDTEAIVNTVEEVEVHQREQPRSRSRSKSPDGLSPLRRSPDRSRASSVTEAVNALRMSVRQHGGKDIDTDTASELNDSRPITPNDQRAPDPVAGDVLFFPAGAQPPSLRASHKPHDIQPETKHEDRTEEVYSYTKIIKASTDEQTVEETRIADETSKQKSSPVLLRSSVVKQRTPEAARSSTRANYLGTRDIEPKPYETEHTVHGASYTYTADIKASMSDRITSLVEDGDKTRFSHYNVGAVTLGGEESGEDEGDGRAAAVPKRAATPPNDFRSSLYSKPIRPSTPPNDIPLISPSESTEIPRLDLQSSSATPRVMHLYRPASPPRDFPITPQSSIIRPRPTTPPFDADTHRDTQRDSHGIQRDSQRESMISNRSEAVNPATGEPGSFQARKRLIERHLQQNVVQTGEKGNTNPNIAHKSAGNILRSEPRAQTSIQPTRTTIVVSPGVIPPAPPPPPMPTK